MTELETLVTDSLPRFSDEDPLYCRPATLRDWEDTWDFGGYDANIYSHGLHQYPARFIPQLVRKIIRTFASSDSSVLDIFSGSGTTLLECKYLGVRDAYGIELNPFAIFMTETKLQDLDGRAAEEVLRAVEEEFFDAERAFPAVSFKNIGFWYSHDAISALSKLFSIISSIPDEKAKRFYLLSFCEVSRRASFLEHGGFKMYRSRAKVRGNFEPDVWAEFYRTARRNIGLLKAGNALFLNGRTRQTLVPGDSRIIHNEIPERSVDLILTSPPYGDSKTTVAYGQYSRLPWQWLSQRDDIIRLDGNLLGGSTKSLDRSILNLSEMLKVQAEQIEAADDSGRVNDVIAFYNDLYAALKSATHYMKMGGYFVLVTGNRTVKKVCLRTDIIITEFARTLGYSTEKVYSRNIINKRMASKNSPTNERGKTVSTMMTENIIILKKV